jgi:hypothetical protein
MNHSLYVNNYKYGDGCDIADFKYTRETVSLNEQDKNISNSFITFNIIPEK